MKRKSFFIGCLSGILLGILICLPFWHLFQALDAANGDGYGTAAEWNSFTAKERTVYVEGYAAGHSIGSLDVCEHADQFFTTTGPMYLKDGTLNHPVTICKASLDQFTRMGERGKVRANYSVYSNTITEFYKKYPKYRNVPFSFLLTLLSDKNFTTADQVFQKLEQHDMQVTF